MMGLYGPDTVAQALEAERTGPPQTVDRSVAVLSAVGFMPVYVPPAGMPPTPAPAKEPKAAPVGEFGTAAVDPAMAEFAAIDALGRKLARLFAMARRDKHRN